MLAGKAILLTIDQLDANDRRFDLFEPEAEGIRLDGPLVVQESGNSFRLVYGFPILSAKQVSDKPFPAYSFPAEGKPVDILKTVIALKREKRALYPIEIARIIHRATDLKVSAGKIISSLSPVMGLKTDQKLIRRYQELLSLERKSVDYLIGKKAPVKTWFSLSRFGLSERRRITELIQLKPSLSVFEELLINIYEISVRERIQVTDLLDGLSWDDIVNNDSLDKKERLLIVRKLLKKRRYPLLSDHREKVETIIRRIPLPGNATLDYDETFEKKELRINWRIESAPDIERMRTFYSNEIYQSLRKLLDAL